MRINSFLHVAFSFIYASNIQNVSDQRKAFSKAAPTLSRFQLWQAVSSTDHFVISTSKSRAQVISELFSKPLEHFSKVVKPLDQTSEGSKEDFEALKDSKKILKLQSISKASERYTKASSKASRAFRSNFGLLKSARIKINFSKEAIDEISEGHNQVFGAKDPLKRSEERLKSTFESY